MPRNHADSYQEVSWIEKERNQTALKIRFIQGAGVRPKYFLASFSTNNHAI